MPDQKPSVCRMVHYVAWSASGGEYKGACRAAVITEVGDSDKTAAGLAVLSPEGLFFRRNVPFDAGPDEPVGTELCGGYLYQGGSWHWPGRV